MAYGWRRNCYGARTSGRSPWGETPRVAGSSHMGGVSSRRIDGVWRHPYRGPYATAANPIHTLVSRTLLELQPVPHAVLLRAQVFVVFWGWFREHGHALLHAHAQRLEGLALRRVVRQQPHGVDAQI